MQSILPRLETNDLNMVEPAEAMPETELVAGIMASFAYCVAAFPSMKKEGERSIVAVNVMVGYLRTKSSTPSPTARAQRSRKS